MLFGKESPEFLLNPTSEAIIIIFNKSTIIEDKYKDDVLTHKSILTGYTTHNIKGTHHEFSIRIHLFKIEGESEQLLTLENYRYLLGKDGYLKKHSDGYYINKKDNSNPVLYTVTQVEDGYFNTPDYKDTVIITFKSKEYIATVPGVIPTNNSSIVVLNVYPIGTRQYSLFNYDGTIITFAQ